MDEEYLLVLSYNDGTEEHTKILTFETEEEAIFYADCVEGVYFKFWYVAKIIAKKLL